MLTYAIATLECGCEAEMPILIYGNVRSFDGVQVSDCGMSNVCIHGNATRLDDMSTAFLAGLHEAITGGYYDD